MERSKTRVFNKTQSMDTSDPSARTGAGDNARTDLNRKRSMTGDPDPSKRKRQDMMRKARSVDTRCELRKRPQTKEFRRADSDRNQKSPRPIQEESVPDISNVQPSLTVPPRPVTRSLSPLWRAGHPTYADILRGACLPSHDKGNSGIILNLSPKDSLDGSQGTSLSVTESNVESSSSPVEEAPPKNEGPVEESIIPAQEDLSYYSNSSDQVTYQNIERTTFVTTAVTDAAVVSPEWMEYDRQAAGYEFQQKMQGFGYASDEAEREPYSKPDLFEVLRSQQIYEQTRSDDASHDVTNNQFVTATEQNFVESEMYTSSHSHVTEPVSSNASSIIVIEPSESLRLQDQRSSSSDSLKTLSPQNRKSYADILFSGIQISRNKGFMLKPEPEKKLVETSNSSSSGDRDPKKVEFIRGGSEPRESRNRQRISKFSKAKSFDVQTIKEVTVERARNTEGYMPNPNIPGLIFKDPKAVPRPGKKKRKSIPAHEILLEHESTEESREASASRTSTSVVPAKGKKSVKQLSAGKSVESSAPVLAEAEKFVSAAISIKTADKPVEKKDEQAVTAMMTFYGISSDELETVDSTLDVKDGEPADSKKKKKAKIITKPNKKQQCEDEIDAALKEINAMESRKTRQKNRVKQISLDSESTVQKVPQKLSLVGRSASLASEKTLGKEQATQSPSPKEPVSRKKKNSAVKTQQMETLSEVTVLKSVSTESSDAGGSSETKDGLEDATTKRKRRMRKGKSVSFNEEISPVSVVVKRDVSNIFTSIENDNCEPVQVSIGGTITEDKELIDERPGSALDFEVISADDIVFKATIGIQKRPSFVSQGTFEENLEDTYEIIHLPAPDHSTSLPQDSNLEIETGPGHQGQQEKSETVSLLAERKMSVVVFEPEPETAPQPSELPDQGVEHSVCATVVNASLPYRRLSAINQTYFHAEELHPIGADKSTPELMAEHTVVAPPHRKISAVMFSPSLPNETADTLTVPDLSVSVDCQSEDPITCLPVLPRRKLSAVVTAPNVILESLEKLESRVEKVSEVAVVKLEPTTDTVASVTLLESPVTRTSPPEVDKSKESVSVEIEKLVWSEIEPEEVEYTFIPANKPLERRDTKKRIERPKFVLEEQASGLETQHDSVSPLSQHAPVHYNYDVKTVKLTPAWMNRSMSRSTSQSDPVVDAPRSASENPVENVRSTEAPVITTVDTSIPLQGDEGDYYRLKEKRKKKKPKVAVSRENSRSEASFVVEQSTQQKADVGSSEPSRLLVKNRIEIELAKKADTVIVATSVATDGMAPSPSSDHPQTIDKPSDEPITRTFSNTDDLSSAWMSVLDDDNIGFIESDEEVPSPTVPSAVSKPTAVETTSGKDSAIEVIESKAEVKPTLTFSNTDEFSSAWMSVLDDDNIGLIESDEEEAKESVREPSVTISQKELTITCTTEAITESKPAPTFGNTDDFSSAWMSVLDDDNIGFIESDEEEAKVLVKESLSNVSQKDVPATLIVDSVSSSEVVNSAENILPANTETKTLTFGNTDDLSSAWMSVLDDDNLGFIESDEEQSKQSVREPPVTVIQKETPTTRTTENKTEVKPTLTFGNTDDLSSAWMSVLDDDNIGFIESDEEETNELSKEPTASEKVCQKESLSSRADDTDPHREIIRTSNTDIAAVYVGAIDANSKLFTLKSNLYHDDWPQYPSEENSSASQPPLYFTESLASKPTNDLTFKTIQPAAASVRSMDYQACLFMDSWPDPAYHFLREIEKLWESAKSSALSSSTKTCNTYAGVVIHGTPLPAPEDEIILTKYVEKVPPVVVEEEEESEPLPVDSEGFLAFKNRRDMRRRQWKSSVSESSEISFDAPEIQGEPNLILKVNEEKLLHKQSEEPDDDEEESSVITKQTAQKKTHKNLREVRQLEKKRQRSKLSESEQEIFYIAEAIESNMPLPAFLFQYDYSGIRDAEAAMFALKASSGYKRDECPTATLSWASVVASGKPVAVESETDVTPVYVGKVSTVIVNEKEEQEDEIPVDDDGFASFKNRREMRRTRWRSTCSDSFDVSESDCTVEASPVVTASEALMDDAEAVKTESQEMTLKVDRPKKIPKDQRELAQLEKKRQRHRLSESERQIIEMAEAIESNKPLPDFAMSYSDIGDAEAKFEKLKAVVNEHRRISKDESHPLTWAQIVTIGMTLVAQKDPTPVTNFVDKIPAVLCDDEPKELDDVPVDSDGFSAYKNRREMRRTKWRSSCSESLDAVEQIQHTSNDEKDSFASKETERSAEEPVVDEEEEKKEKTKKSDKTISKKIGKGEREVAQLERKRQKCRLSEAEKEIIELSESIENPKEQNTRVKAVEPNVTTKGYTAADYDRKIQIEDAENQWALFHYGRQETGVEQVEVRKEVKTSARAATATSFEQKRITEETEELTKKWKSEKKSKPVIGQQVTWSDESTYIGWKSLQDVKADESHYKDYEAAYDDLSGQVSAIEASLEAVTAKDLEALLQDYEPIIDMLNCLEPRLVSLDSAIRQLPIEPETQSLLSLVTGLRTRHVALQSRASRQRQTLQEKAKVRKDVDLYRVVLVEVESWLSITHGAIRGGNTVPDSLPELRDDLRNSNAMRLELRQRQLQLASILEQVDEMRKRDELKTLAEKLYERLSDLHQTLLGACQQLDSRCKTLKV